MVLCNMSTCAHFDEVDVTHNKCNHWLTKIHHQITAKRAFLEAHPLEIVSVVLAAGSLFYISKLALKDLNK